MENASKALLIAAEILIVIILIAFGMNVLNSTADVGGQAKNTGTAISAETGKAALAANTALKGISSWY